MADKKSDTKDEAPNKGVGGMLGMVSKVLGSLAIISAALLFAAIYDVGHFGLRETVFPLAAVPLGVYVICAIATVFLSGGKGAPVDVDTAALTAKIDDLQSKASSRFAVMQNTIDSVMGKDYEALVEENKSLKEQLEAIHQDERGKIDDQVEQLRAKNLELEEQIRKWAIDSVGAAVAGSKAAASKAA